MLYSNIFLGVVDVIGVWRWLGHRARLADTSTAEQENSGRRGEATLFSVATLDGAPVLGENGEVIAHAVDALAACDGGRIDYLIIRRGGIGGVGETLHRLPWQSAMIKDGEIRSRPRQHGRLSAAQRASRKMIIDCTSQCAIVLQLSRQKSIVGHS